MLYDDNLSLLKERVWRQISALEAESMRLMQTWPETEAEREAKDRRIGEILDEIERLSDSIAPY